MSECERGDNWCLWDTSLPRNERLRRPVSRKLTPKFSGLLRSMCPNESYAAKIRFGVALMHEGIDTSDHKLSDQGILVHYDTGVVWGAGSIDELEKQMQLNSNYELLRLVPHPSPDKSPPLSFESADNQDLNLVLSDEAYNTVTKIIKRFEVSL